jgi:HEAT repeat protein
MRNDNYNLIKQNREGITETLNNAGSEVAVKNVIEHTPTIIKETIKRALADFYFFDPEDLDYSLLTVVSRLTTDNEIVSKETVKLFIDYIFNPSNPYRESAIEALGEIGSEEAVKPLLDYISNPANPGRAQALDSLVEIGNKGAVKPFIDYLSNPSNPGIQWALIALGKIESEETVNPSILIECMSNLNNSRRKRVINTLTDKGNKGGIKILKTLLHDYWSYNEDMYDAIHSIHQRLKPQGYIAPQTKELAA